MASEHVVNVTAETFAQEVLQSDVPIIVDFWAEWCGPCKAIAPFYEQLAANYGGKVKVAKVNVDHAQNIAAKYGIQAIPTFIAFKGGQPVNQLRGASKGELEKLFANAAA
ncbi:MAG: thioredoxin [Myxococcales bacterium]|nr:thioredoxin [Myxococcales bacterium]